MGKQERAAAETLARAAREQAAGIMTNVDTELARLRKRFKLG